MWNACFVTGTGLGTRERVMGRLSVFWLVDENDTGRQL